MRLRVHVEFEAADRIADSLEEIQFSLAQIVELLTPPKASSIWFYIEGADGKLRRIKDMNLKVTEKAKLSIKPVDQFGNAAKLEEGSINWASTDPAQGALNVSEDGLSAEFVPAGSLADFQLQVAGDADLGEGQKVINGSLDISLQPGDAVEIQLSAEIVPQ